ncbi:MAG: hypothetical protein DMG06_27750 [Acidobacteria bacterium]|nr:MAG: hypothetical protein DMG06_27750 [Acidobacteriota bacterium]
MLSFLGCFGDQDLSHRILILVLLCLACLCWTRSLNASEILPFIIESKDFRTNLGINNLTSDAAQVRLKLYDNSGTSLSERVVTIPALGYRQINRLVTFMVGPVTDTPFEGYLVLESTKQVRAFAAQIDNISNDPAFIQSRSEGASQLWISSTTSKYPYRSGLAVVNLADKIAQVELKLRGNSGDLLTVLTKQIMPRGQIILPDLHNEMGITEVYGPLEISSKGGDPILGVSRVSHLLNRTHGFLAASYREGKAPGYLIPFVSQSNETRTNVILSNPNSDWLVAELSLIDSSGSVVETTSTSIPPNGQNQLSLSSVFASIKHREFLGSLAIVSELPLLGFASVIQNQSGDPSFPKAVSEGSGQLLIPSASGLPPFLSDVVIVNQGSVAAIVSLRPKDFAGSTLGTPKTFRIPARGQLFLRDVLGELEIKNKYGPVEIFSVNGQPVSAVSQVKNTVDLNGAFMEAIDTTPSVKKRIGESATISWNYDEGTNTYLEFRVYAVERQRSIYRLIKSVPQTQHELNLDFESAGKFIFVITAFNGIEESLRSTEVVVEVTQ